MKKTLVSKECLNCASPEAPFVCNKCKDGSYCNRACQKQHWPDHKFLCVAPESRLPNPAEKRPAGDKCTICLDVLDSALQTLVCGHVFHAECVTKVDKCPLCRRRQPGDCVLCFELIVSDLFEIDDRCEHQMHEACFSDFHFNDYRGITTRHDLICPIAGCDKAVRPDATEFKLLRVQTLLDTCLANRENSDKILLWLFKNTFKGDATSVEGRIKCKVYCLRAIAATSCNLLRSTAEYNLGLLEYTFAGKDTALAAFKRSLAWDPDNVMALSALLDYEDELEMSDLFKLVELAPTDLSVLQRVVEVVYKTYFIGDTNSLVLEFAESLLRRIIDLTKTDGLAYSRLGSILSDKLRENPVPEAIEEAESILRVAIALEEWDCWIDPYWDLADVLNQKGDFDDAQYHYIYSFEHVRNDGDMLIGFCLEHPDKVDLVRIEALLIHHKSYGQFLLEVKKDIPAAEAEFAKRGVPCGEYICSDPKLETMIKEYCELDFVFNSTPPFLPEGVSSLALTPLAAFDLECLD